MIKSYDERDFDEAIKKKNLLKLKIILIFMKILKISMVKFF